jgi:acyl-CoA synthetase (AMP-forming)/AMP-acid ligase II
VIQPFEQAGRALTGDGAGFAMDEIEVRGAPMRVFKSAPPTMRSVWELAALHAAKPYVVYEDESYTYAEIGALVRSLAHHLRDVHGVGSGDRVAIAMRNYPEWIISYWATVAVGAAVVGVNAWWTSQELAYGLADSRPKVLIADDERVERVLPVLDELRATAPISLITVRS